MRRLKIWILRLVALIEGEDASACILSFEGFKSLVEVILLREVGVASIRLKMVGARLKNRLVLRLAVWVTDLTIRGGRLLRKIGEPASGPAGLIF